MSHGLDTNQPVTREVLLQLRGAPAHVVGAASAEGVAVARLLLALGFEHVVVHDRRPREELRRQFRTTHGAYSRVEQDEIWEGLRPLLDRGRFGNDYLADIDPGSLVALGQGWYLDAANREAVVAAVPDSATIVSMTALYAGLAPGPIAAVTGTNGKSTTVALVDHLLTSAEVMHRTAGNERSSRQFLPEIGELEAGTLALLEISNRQLLQLPSGTHVAAITALTPDHLEEHGGMEGYRAAKRRLFELQDAKGIAVANADDPEAFGVARASAGTLVACGTGDHPGPSVLWRDGELIACEVPLLDGDRLGGERTVASVRDCSLPGEHNLRNSAVAVAVALACGAAPEAIAGGLRSFSGKALRLEPIGELTPGVELWSDLKATTPEATIAALGAAGDRRAVLVLGGDDKGLDYGPLAERIVGCRAVAIAVPGTATDALEQALSSRGASLARVPTLEAALGEAERRAAPGDVVIVSPAAAGFWTTQLQGKPSLRALVRRRAAGAPTG